MTQIIDSSREARIRELRRECGCTSGMITMLVCVAAYVVGCLSGHGPTGSAHTLLLGIAAGLSGAVIGKLAGLAWARSQLAALLR